MTTIRPETLADVDEAAAVHVRAWQAGYRGMLPDDYLDGLDPQAWAKMRRDRLEQDLPRQSLIAETHGRLSGFVIFGHKRDEDDMAVFHPELGEIYAIYVDPDFWGTGVADELIKAALEGLTQQEIQLWVLEENHRARKFYARYGLHPDGTRQFYRPRGTEFDAPEVRLSLRR